MRISAHTRGVTQARHNSRSEASTTLSGNSVVGSDAGRGNVLAWGEDIDLVAKVGEGGEGVIDGGCTDGDDFGEKARGKFACVLSVISGGDDDGDPKLNDFGHLWDAC